MVSPISASVIPVIAMISPDVPSETSSLFNPALTKIFSTLLFIIWPVGLSKATSSPVLTIPLMIFPIIYLPL